MNFKSHFDRMLNDVSTNSNGRNIVLWGMCDQTRCFRDVLESSGFVVSKIVDSNNRLVDNNIVFPVTDLEKLSKENYVVVPISYYREIETQLLEYGYIIKRDFSYSQKEFPLPKRADYILKYVDKNKLGLEIGPSYNPLAPKRMGYNVHVIDHLDRVGLINKYSHLAVDTSKIEEVDFVWTGQPYKELTPNKYSWIIASHVIEHVPDFIHFLNDCADILTEDGILSLAIPDKRFCFDHFRPLTSLALVIDKYLRQERLHSPGTLTEYYLNTCRNSGQSVWGTYSSNQKYHMIHNINEAKERLNTAIHSAEYMDAHAYCFVPHSFRLLIQDLFELGLIRLREVDFYSINGSEFYMTLGIHSNLPIQDRLHYLQLIEEELKKGDTPCVE